MAKGGIKRNANHSRRLSKVKRATKATMAKRRRMSKPVWKTLHHCTKIGYFSDMRSADYRHMRGYLMQIEPWKTEDPLPQDIKDPADKKTFLKIIQKSDGFALEGWSVIANPQKIFLSSLLSKEQLQEVLVHEVVHLLLATDEETALSNHKILLREEVLCEAIVEVYAKRRKLGVKRLKEIARNMKDCLTFDVDVDYRWVQKKIIQLYSTDELKRYFTPDLLLHKIRNDPKPLINASGKRS